MPTFPRVSAEELARAQQRVRQRGWQAAADALRREAPALVKAIAERPAFDAAWYDQNPSRDFAETYNEFAAYAYPATAILRAAERLLLIDAVFQETAFTAPALDATLYVARRLKFHVQHHDAGLSYAHIAVALAAIFTYAQNSLAAADRQIILDQLRSAGEALRLSTRHWLTVLARMPYNNHFAHQRLGLLAVALVLKDQPWIDEALTGPRNFGELLVGSTTDDGLCYESSTVYHFGTLAGLLQSAALVAHHPELGRDFFRETFANGRSIKHMFDAPLQMLLPNGELPSVGDCYTNRVPIWQLHADIYEQAYAVYEDPAYAWVIQKGGVRRNLSALLYGPDSLGPAVSPMMKSKLWIEHGYGLLVGPRSADYFSEKSAAAFLTSDRSGIHHHQDALSIQVALAGKIILDDPEAAAVELQGFAAPIQKDFNRTMLPHNLVVVDQQDQPDLRTPLPVLEFKNNADCSTIAVGDLTGAITPNVVRLRCLTLTSDYVLDVYQIQGSTPHTYDLLLHPRRWADPVRRRVCAG